MKIKVTKAVNNHSVNNDYLALILEWGPEASIFQSEVVYKDFVNSFFVSFGEGGGI